MNDPLDHIGQKIQKMLSDYLNTDLFIKNIGQSLYFIRNLERKTQDLKK